MSRSAITWPGMRNESVMYPGPYADKQARSAWELANARDEAFRLTELRATEFRAAIAPWVEAFHAGTAGDPPEVPRAVAVAVERANSDTPDFQLVDSESPALEVDPPTAALIAAWAAGVKPKRK